MLKVFLRLLCTFIVVSFGTNVFAQTSEWMSGKDAFAYANKLGRANMIVTGMECKDSGKVEFGLVSALVRLTYEPNTKMLDWQIDGWNNLKANVEYWKERGFKLQKYTVFYRKKSGVKLFCTLYYK